MANIQYYDVILKPVITEKSMDLMADKKRIRSKRLLRKCSAAQR